MRIIAALVTIAIFYSCDSTRESTKQDKSYEGLVPAMILDYSELDGCEYILTLNDGQKLQPIELPDEFASDSMRVLISYKFLDQPGICMTGRIIQLNAIVADPAYSK